MGFVLNATNEEQRVRAHGNWFTLKPKQIKQFADNLSMFLIMERGDQGLVGLSEKFEDPEYKLTAEGKAEMATAETAGINAFVEGLRKRVYNNQVSLRQDLEKANIKVDPSALATDADLEAMRLLAKYQKAKDDETQERVNEAKELMKTIGNATR